MPETENPTPAPASTTSTPTPSTSSNKTVTYLIGGIVLALIVSLYTYINKYRLDETTITTLNKTITDTKAQLDQKTKDFSDYKRTVESNTSWVETDYYPTGAIQKQRSYNKSSVGTTTGATTILSNLAASTISTTASTTATTETKRDQSGVPINGAVWVALPFETFVGKIPSLGLGIDHQFIFDFTVGAEVGVSDITKPLSSIYGNFLVGHGIP